MTSPAVEQVFNKLATNNTKISPESLQKFLTNLLTYQPNISAQSFHSLLGGGAESVNVQIQKLHPTMFSTSQEFAPSTRNVELNRAQFKHSQDKKIVVGTGDCSDYVKIREPPNRKVQPTIRQRPAAQKASKYKTVAPEKLTIVRRPIQVD
jgi:hypothetical protein